MPVSDILAIGLCMHVDSGDDVGLIDEQRKAGLQKLHVVEATCVTLCQIGLLLAKLDELLKSGVMHWTPEDRGEVEILCLHETRGIRLTNGVKRIKVGAAVQGRNPATWHGGPHDAPIRFNAELGENGLIIGMAAKTKRAQAVFAQQVVDE